MDKVPVVCTLGPADLQRRRAEMLNGLLQQAVQRQAIASGRLTPVASACRAPIRRGPLVATFGDGQHGAEPRPAASVAAFEVEVFRDARAVAAERLGQQLNPPPGLVEVMAVQIDVEQVDVPG